MRARAHLLMTYQVGRDVARPAVAFDPIIDPVIGRPNMLASFVVIMPNTGAQARSRHHHAEDDELQQYVTTSPIRLGKVAHKQHDAEEPPKRRQLPPGASGKDNDADN